MNRSTHASLSPDAAAADSTISLHQAVAEACGRCALTCEAALSDAAEDDVSFSELLRDAATYCHAVSVMLIRQSEYAEYVASVCADICDRLADECSTEDVDWCRTCAAIARRCADGCRRVAG